MSQTLITSTVLTREFLQIFHSNCHAAKLVDRTYEEKFGNTAWLPTGKIGPSLQIRVPNMYTVQTGWPMVQQDLSEKYRTLTVDTPLHVDLNFTDAELALDVDDFDLRYVEPAAKRLAAEVDKYLLAYMAKYTNNCVGVPGTSPNASSTFLSAGQLVKQNLCPMDGNLYTIIGPRTEASIVATLAGQYNPNSNISEMYLKGQMSSALGLEWYMSQLNPTVATGTRTTGGGMTVSAYSGTNSTITVTGFTSSGTIGAGESFTVSGCYAVNPETKQTYSTLQQFTCTEAYTASGTTATIPVYPAPVLTGPYQNISATPVGGTPVFGTISNASSLSGTSVVYPCDFVFHKKAFALATVPLELPRGMDMAARASADGISVRFVRGYDIRNAQMLSRMDIFFGYTYLRPEWSCKVLG